MNKKGFTLIELISVITLISIVLLIAIPEIASRTVNNKIEKCNRFVGVLKSSLITYTEFEVNDNDSKNVTLSDLDSNDYIVSIPNDLIPKKVDDMNNYANYEFTVSKNNGIIDVKIKDKNSIFIGSCECTLDECKQKQ